LTTINLNIKENLHFLCTTKSILFILLFGIFTGAQAQVPSCTITLRNDTLLDASHMKVDIYVIRTGATELRYGAGQFKFTFNTAIKNGANGVVRAYIIPGTTELSNPAQVNNTITIPTAAQS
jgi:hypothetical protein